MRKIIKYGMVNNGLIVLNLVFVFLALLLSVISSTKAYSLSQINWVIASSVIVIILDVIAIVISSKTQKKMINDVLHFITTVLITAALCMMISGRVLLMGYVYFSDLESGNPVAVSALNFAVIAWIIYMFALIINIIIGFKKNDEIIEK